MKLILPAYRRNIRNACAALGNRKLPNGYTTATATNGDFIVYSGGHIVGRLEREKVEPFCRVPRAAQAGRNCPA